MSARANKRRPEAAKPLSAGSTRSREQQADGGWLVASWPGRQGEHQYTCPICGRRLAPDTAHLVVWPEPGSAADRRHVHTACWRRRSTQREPVRW